MKPNKLKNIISEEIERVIQQEAGKIELSKLICACCDVGTIDLVVARLYNLNICCIYANG